jgi:hypothetical protein
MSFSRQKHRHAAGNGNDQTIRDESNSLARNDRTRNRAAKTEMD